MIEIFPIGGYSKVEEKKLERIAREKRIEDAAPYRQYEAPLTPRDKDY